MGCLSSSSISQLWDKMVQKPVLENGLCNLGFGVSLPQKGREPPAVFKGS